MGDTYKTITGTAEGLFTEKRSKFIAYAVPVRTVEEVKEQVEKFRKQYYDARHVCWAYMLGHERKNFRANDDGEPSGTAGKPILGQINSNELTNILVVVIRYFGGIKLGTGGLIVAYKAAAAEVLAVAEVEERTVDVDVKVIYEYPFMNGVMRIIKEMNVEIVSQSFDMDCEMTLRIRMNDVVMLKERLLKVDSLRILEDEDCDNC
ncbi:MAG: IMPACT family protein [Tannerellaceae bacterium]